GHPEGGVGETPGEEAPELIVFTEIDGAVHGLHSAAGEPLAAGIKKQARGFRIVDAFKESHPTGGLIGEPCLLFVDEGGHPTDGFVLPVFQYPSGNDAVGMVAVFLWIENGFDLRVQWAHEHRVVPINERGYV